MGNMVLEAPTLEVLNSERKFLNKQLGFWRGAQTRKYDFGDAYAVNRKCHKGIQKEIVDFWRGAEIKE